MTSSVSETGPRRRSAVPSVDGSPCRSDIQSVTHQELVAQLAAWGQPKYRADQILAWVYLQCVGSWGEMRNLPRSLREKLDRHYSFHPLTLVRRQGAADSTRKFLWCLRDHSLVESVLIPANPGLYGDASDRHTLCVSTQVGCAYGCRFCASGLDGWKRNLGVAEIVGQVLAAEREARSAHQAPTRVPGSTGQPSERSDRIINNLVIMGMGEPFANYEHLLSALRILNAPWGGRFGARKITVSTSGLAPQIRRFAQEPEQFGLAISLHGATDAVRNRIMPVNRKYPLRELISACEAYRRAKGRMLTLEYILIAGLNDRPEDARCLAEVARRLNAKVNLIPYNQVEGLAWKRPSESAQDGFRRILERQRVSATLRREKGHDIDAACGQLRLRTERVSDLKLELRGNPGLDVNRDCAD